MDNLTHTLFALTLARAPLGRAGRGTAAALVIASNAPDIDIVTAARGGVTSYLQWHRGPTHGILGVLGLGVVTAALVWWAYRFTKDEEEPRAPFGILVAVSVVAVLLHILMDFPTSYGTRLLSPFDWHWYAVDVMPIVDIYLIVILTAGLLFGLASPEAQRRNAIIALLLMTGNYGLRGAAHHRALEVAPEVFGATLPPPCNAGPPDTALIDRWPRDAAPPLPAGHERCLVETAAMPSFVSPFRWRLIARMSDAYYVRDLDLLDTGALHALRGGGAIIRTTVRFPNIWTDAVLRAASTHASQIFLGFARFPAARSFRDAAGATTVNWADVRFVGGLMRAEQPGRQPPGLGLTIRIAPDGSMQELPGK